MQDVSGVRLPEMDKERIAKIIEMGYYVNSADFLRDAVRGKLEEFEFAFVRDVDKTKAKKEVLEYVKQNPNIYADDIAAKLNLDIETVINAIEELIKEEKVTA